MRVIETVAEMRAARAGIGNLGLVPTMGYLHEGHLSLVTRAKAECDTVAASIFVNPTQFGPAEDLARYPRDLPRDLQLLEAAGVDLVFAPEPAQMYPPGFDTAIAVGGVTDVLEGAVRPGHFAGVATVVAKLFNIVQPTRAYFGQKDAQQAVVIRKLARDLNMPVEVIIAPTVREPDGLALSSRNSYLAPAERAAAPSDLPRPCWKAADCSTPASATPRRCGTPCAAIVDAEPSHFLPSTTSASPILRPWPGTDDRVGEAGALAVASPRGWEAPA